MGIKHLNNFLIENCSTNAIHKLHLRCLANKTVVVDTSIYLYKFAEKNAVAENMYLLISVFREYNITPVFVFDGKPPPEKKEMLLKRKIEKDAAETRFKELQSSLPAAVATTSNIDASTNEVLKEMDALKRKFVRVSDSDIRQAKSIMSAYGVPYIESHGESDQLCAFLVKHGFAWACVSDDMDMFLYGCPRVLRHVSLLNHDVIQYVTKQILHDLDMSQEVFNDIAILSGTDYNVKEHRPLSCIVRLFMEYRQWCHFHAAKPCPPFHVWLVEINQFMESDAALVAARHMFDLDVYLEHNREEIKHVVDCMPFRTGNVQHHLLQETLKEDGFIFL
jgi:hypothetical protein